MSNLSETLRCLRETHCYFLTIILSNGNIGFKVEHSKLEALDQCEVKVEHMSKSSSNFK